MSKAKRVVVAPDKFRGSLSALEAGLFLAQGIHDVLPDCWVDVCPIADGGEGTIDAVAACGFDVREVEVVDLAAGSRIRGRFAFRGQTAVIELAEFAGLGLIQPSVTSSRDATSFALGQAISLALDDGYSEIVLGLGGSASTDGGAGMMHALGLVFLDATGRRLVPGIDDLSSTVTLDTDSLDSRLANTTFVVASDVENVLLGPSGAALVFGPQKGADAMTVLVLEERLRRYSDAVRTHIGRDYSDVPGSGAAGGVAFSAVAFLGARLQSGVDLILELSRFAARAADSDLIITGEGSLDEQTLGGKAPMGVVRNARQLGIPVVAVAGRCSLTPQQIDHAGFDGVYSLQDVEPDPSQSMRNAKEHIRVIGRHIASARLEPTSAQTHSHHIS
ncbi:glycerate kinase [Agreia bicolorata]|uniref:Glycerate kinase n=1 Tax=Agreia bicolorata TaxID=110935 RepID=A0A1T4WWA1_9MICO|nr:glycerate kinase [Agreia bicolorata]SKA81662.1 glycerate kinase [Agreia bicolorata]